MALQPKTLINLTKLNKNCKVASLIVIWKRVLTQMELNVKIANLCQQSKLMKMMEEDQKEWKLFLTAKLTDNYIKTQKLKV